MRRADRLTMILDVLQERRVMTAQELSTHLGVSKRTIYRDIQTLSEQGISIEGEAGVGYALSGHVRLPPLMFSREELEALWLGTRIVSEWSDEGLGQAAQGAMARIRAVIPPHMERHLEESSLLVPPVGATRRNHGPMPEIRRALDEKRKLRLSYTRYDGQKSTRVVRPLALSFWNRGWLLSAWCEKRKGFRSFRMDRIEQFTVMRMRFRDEPGKSLSEFYAGMQRDLEEGQPLEKSKK